MILLYNNIMYAIEYIGSDIFNFVIEHNLNTSNDIINNTEYSILNIKKGIIIYNNGYSAGHEICYIIGTLYNLYNLNMLDDYDIILNESTLNLNVL